MKKFLLTFFAAMAAIVSFAGDGTKENPMTVADVLAASMDESTVWVKAYIVGSVNGTKMEELQFSAVDAKNTNLALADAQNETNRANCIPLQLPTGNIRAALNLVDHPDNLGKELLIQAKLIKYFGQNGLKEPADFVLSGEGSDFVAALTDNKGNWTFEDVILPEGLNYIWAQSSQYGMKASAFANGTKYVSDSYLVSPALVLGENSVLTFEHVQRYAAEDPATQLTLLIRGDKPDSWQYQLPIPNYSDGSSWTFVSSGDIDLSAYAGKTIQLWFRYTSDENFAATWEIKNVKVTNAKTAEEGPTLKDPSNTPETAYTIAQAIEIIQNRDSYDMSKEVYTKGTIREIKSIDVSQYERAQYWIGDASTEERIQVYNGYYLEGKPFTANDQIKEDDEVIVCGRLTLYNTTYEIDANNYIYSLNGKTKAEGEEPSLKDPSNTPESAYTIAQAIEIINDRENYDMTKEVYTKGTIKSIKSLDVSKYPRAQYWIGDASTEEQIQVYNGYYLEGKPFTADDQIKEGDEVIVCGKLTLYNTTYEIAADNYIYSLNGKTKAEGEEPETPTKTIAEIQAGENGKYKTEGTVMAVCTRGGVVGDATGYIYIYDQNFASAVGDQVTVEGTTSTYGGFKQFSASAGYELTKTGTTTVSYPEPVVMDGAAMEAWIAAPVIQYVTYAGTLAISGNYYNVTLSGAETAQGSLVYLPDALKAGLADGDDVFVTGFAMYISGGKYVNTVVTQIEVSPASVELVKDGQGEAPVYDLSGRRVENPAKGLYIKAGKKIVVK